MNLKVICLTLVLFGVDSDRPVTPFQDFYWRDYVHGSVPIDAFEGKPEIYIGQVYYYNSNLVPVAIYPYRNAAVMVDGFQRDVKENIKILCAYNTSNFYWEKVKFDKKGLKQMGNAVKAGLQDGQDLFLGAVRDDNDWKIGKVKDMWNPNDKGLHVWDRHGNETTTLRFELLKYNSSSLPLLRFDMEASSFQIV